MTKDQKISLTLLNKMQSYAKANRCALNDRAALESAFEQVFGKGAFDRTVTQIYETLRAVK